MRKKIKYTISIILFVLGAFFFAQSFWYSLLKECTDTQKLIENLLCLGSITSVIFGIFLLFDTLIFDRS